MEQKLPIIAKKFMKISKVIFFMLRKGISKAKLLANLNMMMKRGKILIFHHHHHGGAASAHHHLFANDYEFNKRKHSHAPPTEEELAAEMFDSGAASPALPGFGPSPMVRKLRVTDSPFPLTDVEEDSHVDELAEEFILRFYKDLRQQNSMPYLG